MLMFFSKLKKIKTNDFCIIYINLKSLFWELIAKKIYFYNKLKEV